MLMSSSRVRAIKLPGASTTSKFPEPASMCPASCVSVRSVRCDTNRTPLVTLSARIGPTNSPLIVKLPLAFTTSMLPPRPEIFTSPFVSKIFASPRRISRLSTGGDVSLDFRVATPHIQAHISAGAVHFDVAIAVIDVHLGRHVRNVHVGFFAVDRQQRLLRHSNVQIHANPRISSAARRPHLIAIAVLYDLRGYSLADFLRGAFAPALHVNFARHANLRLIGSANRNVPASPAHSNARIRRHRFRRHIDAAGKRFANIADIIEHAWNVLAGPVDTDNDA